MQRNRPYLQTFPDEKWVFCKFGGSFIPPQLEEPFNEINEAYKSYQMILNF